MLCSVQPAPLDADAFLRDPDALLEPPPAALCDALDVGAGDLLRHVVHVEAHDASCGGRAFQRVVGRLVVRHPRSHRIARLPFVSDQMTAGDSVYAITRLTYEVERRRRRPHLPERPRGARAHAPPPVAARDAPGRRVRRRPRRAHAARVGRGARRPRAAALPVRRQRLARDGGRRHRHLPLHALPVRCLGATAPLPTAALWCVVAPGAGECVVVAAAAEEAWRAEVGDAPCEGAPLDDFVARVASAAERARVRREVLAQLPALPADARLVDALHAAAAPAGARRYDVVAQPVGCVVALTLAPPEARGGAAEAAAGTSGGSTRRPRAIPRLCCARGGCKPRVRRVRGGAAHPRPAGGAGRGGGGGRRHVGWVDTASPPVCHSRLCCARGGCKPRVRRVHVRRS